MPVVQPTMAAPDNRDLEEMFLDTRYEAAEGDGRNDPGPPPSPPGNGGGRQPSRNLPPAVAVAVVVVVAVLLTYLGMLTQIWANLSGAQLPGA